jgi:CheY-specific phosphatase CheX
VISPLLVNDLFYIVVGDSLGQLSAFQVENRRIELKKTTPVTNSIVTGLDGGTKGKSVLSSDSNGAITIWSSAFEKKLQIPVEQFADTSQGYDII